jgi:hypothetical protein
MSNCAQVTQGGDLIAEGKISVVHQKEAPKPTADAAEKEDAPEVPAAEETPQAETDADVEAEPTEVLEYQQPIAVCKLFFAPINGRGIIFSSHHNLSHCSIL